MSDAATPPAKRARADSTAGGSRQLDSIVFSCQSGDGKTISAEFGCSSKMVHYCLLAGVADGQPCAVVAKGDPSMQRLHQLVKEQQVSPDTVLAIGGVSRASSAFLAGVRNVDHKFAVIYEFAIMSSLRRVRDKEHQGSSNVHPSQQAKSKQTLTSRTSTSHHIGTRQDRMACAK